MSTKLDRLTELAKEEPKRQFFSIAHLIPPEALYAAFRSLRKEASAGVDGVTYQEYQKDAERKIQELSAAQRWKVPSPTASQGLHTEGEREAETNLDLRSGGQDRAEGDGGSTERHL
jgi:hypothetical protein